MKTKSKDWDKRDWEGSFNEQFPEIHGRRLPNKIKSFISRLLEEQRGEILNTVRVEIACYSQISAENTKELISLIKGAILDDK